MPATTQPARPMEIGVGWRHPHYVALLEQQPPLDFLEVHSENFFANGGAALAVLEAGRSHYPISLHGVGLSLGSAVGVDAWHLDQLAHLVERLHPVRVSDHACFARGSFQGATVHAADLLPLPFSSEALDVLCANVAQVQDRLKRPILVENLSAYIHWKPVEDTTTWLETDFLSELSRRTGCELLVDVNNIYVNALNAQKLGLVDQPIAACKSWLESIAPVAVGEIHLAGHSHVSDTFGDIVVDDHGSLVCEAVWDLYSHAIAHFGPVPTLVEWDTDIPCLDTLVGEATRARALAQEVIRGYKL
ncbi:DUF692 domain-containing protein [Rhodoferax aquaticus]|uniref:DUF692 domain-containing protein n=1 Tax=Rhodoferax aquaticus TaxID=2527691 RepID=A0A515EV60_9BURK|nr:DUF692 domain-containing protein [Rhodoferax aquaticus]QDL56570.1 DUF692 domain-containing protein [Rhodoferax aquaticus]